MFLFNHSDSRNLFHKHEDRNKYMTVIYSGPDYTSIWHLLYIQGLIIQLYDIYYIFRDWLYNYMTFIIYSGPDYTSIWHLLYIQGLIIQLYDIYYIFRAWLHKYMTFIIYSGPYLSSKVSNVLNLRKFLPGPMKKGVSKLFFFGKRQIFKFLHIHLPHIFCKKLICSLLFKMIT